MRICLYTESALPKLGGQEFVVDALARQFQKLGQEVVVLAPYPRRLRTCDASLPYPVERHPRFFSTRFLVAWYRRWLLKLRRRFPFDVLHCHGVYPPGYLAALTRDQLGVPVLITSHGGDIREDNVRLAKPELCRRNLLALEKADALVSISRFTHDHFRRLCPNARQIVSIPNGVDLAPYAVAAPRPENLDPAIRSREYVLFLGRLKRRKGVDLLLDALAQVPANGKVQLMIAGDGEERPELEAQARRLALTDRVRFVGAVTGSFKTYLLQNAMCTAVPSREWEAFGLVVLESYAGGAPVLASRLAGMQDLVQEGHTGWQVPVESPPEIARVLTRLFADANLAHSRRTNVLRYVRDFSWQAVAERHVQLYQELAISCHSARAG